MPIFHMLEMKLMKTSNTIQIDVSSTCFIRKKITLQMPKAKKKFSPCVFSMKLSRSSLDGKPHL